MCYCAFLCAVITNVIGTDSFGVISTVYSPPLERPPCGFEPMWSLTGVVCDQGVVNACGQRPFFIIVNRECGGGGVIDEGGLSREGLLYKECPLHMKYVLL